MFVQGGDGAIWELLQPVGGSIAAMGWSSLGKLPGMGGIPTDVTGPVSTALAGDGSFALLARDSAGSSWLSALPAAAGSFGAWTLIGGSAKLASPAELTREADGRLTVVGLGSDLNVWRIAQAAPGGPWQRAFAPLFTKSATEIYGRPAVGLDASGRRDYHLRSPEGLHELLLREEHADGVEW